MDKVVEDFCTSLVPHKNKKSFNSLIFNQLRIKALFVRAKGLEPIRLSAPDPKSGLSTNFNTPATVFNCFSFEKDCKNTTKY